MGTRALSPDVLVYNRARLTGSTSKNDLIFKLLRQTRTPQQILKSRI
jgi:hypothetical protein